eukprot:g4005.t1
MAHGFHHASRAWSYDTLCPGFKPRQFEYHPTDPRLLVFGTIHGEVVVVDHLSDAILSSNMDIAGNAMDSVLGLCWLNRSPDRFVMGSSRGVLKLCKVRQGATLETTPFMKFEDLTSVHVNSIDERMIASGYASDVNVYDMATQELVRSYDGIHSDHINITRFANNSPNIFGTSSFDCTVKMWDLRLAGNKPIYTCKSEEGLVMLCFSPDDLYLLTSAVDNNVRQYLTVDGRLQNNLNIEKTHNAQNYTRSYYMNGGDTIITGSSEESCVRLFCSHTGNLLHTAEMYPGRKDSSLYVQSLRGEPHRPHHFSVLVNYRDTYHPLEIVRVDMTSQCERNEIIDDSVAGGKSSLESQIQQPSCHTAGLTENLRELLLEGTGADIAFVTHREEDDGDDDDRGTILAHACIVGARSLPLRRRIESARESTAEGDAIHVPIPETVTRRAFRATLEYIYTDFLVPPQSAVPGMTVPTAAHALRDIFDPQSRKDIRREKSGLHGGKSEDEDMTSTTEEASTEDGTSASHHGKSNDDDADSKGRHLRYNVWDFTYDLQFASEILHAARVMDLPRMAEITEWWLEKSICAETVRSLATMASKFGADQLLASCMHFILCNLEKLCSANEPFQGNIERLEIPEECRKELLALQTSCMVDVPYDRCCDDYYTSDVNSPVEFVRAYMSDFGALLESAEFNTMCSSGNFTTHNERQLLQSMPHLSVPLFRAALQLLSTHFSKTSSDDGEGDGDAMTGYSTTGSLRPFRPLAGSYNAVNRQYQALRTRLLDDNPNTNDSEEETAEQRMRAKEMRSFNMISNCTGHRLVKCSGDRVIVVGGGNRMQFIPFQRMMELDLKSLTWSKRLSVGTLPPGLLYHACCEIDSSRRHIALFAGEANGRGTSDLYILDSEKYIWERMDSVRGEKPLRRSGHSLVCLSTGIPDLGDAQLGNGQRTFMLSFGGYTRRPNRECHRDVAVLVVRTTRRSAFSDEPSAAGNGPSSEIREFQHDCVWRWPTVRGEEPDHRLAHSATVLDGPSDFRRHHRNALGMVVVFGGVGYQALLNDVCVLRIGESPDVEVAWLRVETSGQAPSRRFGHCATAIDARRIVYFGGMTQAQNVDDVHMLTFTRASSVEDSDVYFHWAKVEPKLLPPMPLCRSSMVLDSHRQSLLVFGGSVHLRDAGDRNVDSNVHMLVLGGHLATSSSSSSSSSSSQDECFWTVAQTRLNDFGIAPIIKIGRSSLSEDLRNLVAEPFFPDFTFSLSLDGADCETYPDSLSANKAILICRSERMRAALHTSGMKESRTSSIELAGMDPVAFSAMLRFMYGDVITQDVLEDPQMLMQLLVVANEHTMHRLSRLCEGALLRLLHVENAAEFLEFADMYGDNRVVATQPVVRATQNGILRQGAVSFLLRYFEEAKETEGFAGLREELREEILALHQSIHVYQAPTAAAARDEAGGK